MIPWLVPLSGFFFAAIQTGAAGMERTAGVPKEIALVLQAVIILFVASRVSGALLASSGRRAGGGDDA
jgi:simple sugar transport system permease protein